MSTETRTCQNCTQPFTIEPDDFDFYKKIDVPPPTFCPECRFQRRLMFRNERVLYKRSCDLCKKSMISVFAPDKPYKAYCNACWWSDSWDPLDFGQDYDPTKNFFQQFGELQRQVPYMNLIVDYPTLVNSEYVNHCGNLKNCYLTFDSDRSENILYCRTVNNLKDSMDCIMNSESELCYYNVAVGGYKVFFSEDIISGSEIYFSKDLVGCSNCFGCVGLRNKQYHIFNQPHAKEEYKKKLEGFNLHSFANLTRVRKQCMEFWLTAPHKFMHGFQNVDVSGDYVYFSKSAHDIYQSRFVEDGRFCQFVSAKPGAKDVYDYSEWGEGAERVYECITSGSGVNTMKFCYACYFANSMNVEYSMFLLSCSNMFGCVGMRKKEYCILNKPYSKKEFETLRAKIISDMNETPYIDRKSRVWKYGEFFPYDFSLFDYNESTAIQYYKFTKNEILDHGWRFREPPELPYKPTLTSDQLPDSIREVTNAILNEILECAECHKPFKVVAAELGLLRTFDFPLPRMCPDCRYGERMKRINPLKLWERTCAKCGKKITTSYAPDRPEIVYCERCYQAEVT